ncbi:MAG: hypothetical protein WCB15_12285, partial [Desulfobacterales bacterium]
ISVIRESGHAQAGSNADLQALIAQKNLIPYPSLNFLCLLRGMSLINSGKPGPVFKKFVDQCLRDKGYQPVVWR